jgi:prephenate dehydrogenase
LSAPLFERVAIVGFGLIGGSLARALRRRWPAGRIVAIDRRPVVESALGLGAADEGAGDLAAASGADLIVLAAPVRQNIAVLRELGGAIRETALVTDVGSTKRATVEASRQLPARLRFVGGHPLAGAATGGLDATRDDLFTGRPWILTPIPQCDPQDVETLRALIDGLGAVPKTMDPIAHDRLMAYLSHLPQIAVSALMQVVGERAGAEGLALAGTGLRDTTRLASSPASTWRDVTATNVDALGSAIDELTTALQRLKSDLTVGDELERVFGTAHKWKRVLDDSNAASREDS